MQKPTVKKTILFWAAIFILGAMLQKVLPLGGISAWEGFVLSVGIVYLAFRGACVIIYEICVWIQKRWGQSDSAA
jgi:hypothetical protein